MRSHSAPRKLSTTVQLHASAIRALMRRAYSVRQMREYLERRAEAPDMVPQVLARLRELRYLDDARYALEYARQHAQTRRQGRFRIARELRVRGISDAHIEASLDTVFSETDESASARARIQRKLAHIRGPIDQRKLASLYRTLLRAGFSSDVIRAELRGVSRGDLPEFPESE